MRISGGTAGSALLMRSEPRLSGRNWQTDAVKPENECSFSPILSVENGRKWIWMSGVASRGLVLKNAPDVPAAIVSGPLRSAAQFAPALRGAEIGECGAGAPSAPCRGLEKSGAFLARAVEVGIGGNTGLGRGHHKSFRQRIGVPQVGHRQRAVDAMIFVGAALLVL